MCFCVGSVERARERELVCVGLVFGEDRRENLEWRLAREQQA